MLTASILWDVDPILVEIGPLAVLLLVFSYRFMVEFVRMHQAAFGDALPLSVGQLLSIPLILLGLSLTARAWKHIVNVPSQIVST